MKTKIFVLGIICLFLITCGIFGPEKIIDIKGTITDSTTGTPIDRAYLLLYRDCATLGYDCGDTHHTRSDKDGHYSIYCKPIGLTPPYELNVGMTGYVRKEITLRYSADVQIINVQLEPLSDFQ